MNDTSTLTKSQPFSLEKRFESDYEVLETLFLFYSLIGTVLVLIGLVYHVVNYELTAKEECNDGVFILNSFRRFKFLGEMINNELFIIMNQVYCNISDGIHMALAIIACFFLFLAAFYSFELQTLLFLKNKTWVESVRLKKSQNTPYCYNEKMKNLRMVLGSSRMRWFLPIVETNDGYSYPKPNIENFTEIEDKYYKMRYTKSNDLNQNSLKKES